MAFKVFRFSREIEIISVIDIVFLLLIFGIVISAANMVRSDDPGPVPDPIVTENTLEIAVERKMIDEYTQVSKVTVFMPGNPDDPPTYDFPTDEEFLLINDQEFSQLNPCRLIAESIRQYANEYTNENDRNSLKNQINVTVTEDTKLRIISFIISECSYYGNMISWLDVRISTD